MVGVKTNILKNRVTITGRDKCTHFISEQKQEVKDRVKDRLKKIEANSRKLRVIKTFTQEANHNGRIVEKTTFLITVDGHEKPLCLHFSDTKVNPRKDKKASNKAEKTETVEASTEPVLEDAVTA